MRLLFLLLLAANIALFAWTRFLAPADPGIDRQPLARQIDPGKLRIVRESDLGRARAAPAKPAAVAPKPRAPAPTACVEWGSFNPGEASRATRALDALDLGARLAQYRGEEPARWWVHYPPQGNRANALKKAAELRKLGITDFFIVQEAGATQWSLSLGLFTTQEAAKAHLAALQERGVRTALIDERETQVPKVWFQVREVDAALQARLEALAKDFEGATLHECAARG
ncbi:MAG TPA: SPOR domain-containing protein [Burkholderiales bacterium]|nr:SPOR domain-containing protein [Burkholderiales bacterium]